MSSLFTPVKLGALELENRMVMAPMTRGRAGESRTPNDIMADYYGQRASAGLIITEATPVSAQGYGWNGAPGVYADAHEAGWKLTTDAVHAKGGVIALQLWHTGRVSHPDFLDGETPVGPSPIAAAGESHTPLGKKPYVTPRELDADELPGIAEDFAKGAERAMRAGFDAVEVHCANGYLLDQFLRDGSNQRTDEYGGSIQNRVHFPMSVIQAVVDVAGSDRVGVRVSPSNPFNDMQDSDSMALFTHFAQELNSLNLAYLHVMEPFSDQHPFFSPGNYHSPTLREAFDGHLMINGGYDAESGAKALDDDLADSVAYGVPYIANPDLVRRYREGISLSAPDPTTFYTPGPEGYNDYPPAD